MNRRSIGRKNAKPKGRIGLRGSDLFTRQRRYSKTGRSTPRSRGTFASEVIDDPGKTRSPGYNGITNVPSWWRDGTFRARFTIAVPMRAISYTEVPGAIHSLNPKMPFFENSASVKPFASQSVYPSLSLSLGEDSR